MGEKQKLMTDKPILIVTGSSGLLGMKLQELAQNRYELICLDIRSSSDPIDLGDCEAVEKFWKEFPQERASKVAGVLYFAAYYDFTNHPNPQYLRLQEGLKVFLKGFSLQCPKTAPFVFASSMAALAPTLPGHALTPESPKAGLWQYPKSKIACEKILDDSSIDQPIVQLVTAGVYSDQCELVPLFNWIESARKNILERTFFPGNPHRGLTFVHLNEAVEAYLLAVEKIKEPKKRVRLLLGEEKPLTFFEIRGLVLKTWLGISDWPLIRLPKSLVWLGAWVLSWLAKLQGKRRFVQPWMIPFAEEHFEFDLSATKKELSWFPKKYLGNELPKILEWAKSHEGKWLSINRKRPW